MKPLGETLGPAREALLAELCWSILKWLYHHAEKQELAEFPTEFINFKSAKYAEKLAEIYRKYPAIKDGDKIFTAALALLCAFGLIKSLDATHETHREVLYALTDAGADETERWFKGNGHGF